MTENPTQTKDFKKLTDVTFNKFLSLLDEERPIIQRRAAEHAKKTSTPLYIRGISSDERGTWIGKLDN